MLGLSKQKLENFQKLKRPTEEGGGTYTIILCIVSKQANELIVCLKVNPLLYYAFPESYLFSFERYIVIPAIPLKMVRVTCLCTEG